MPHKNEGRGTVGKTTFYDYFIGITKPKKFIEIYSPAIRKTALFYLTKKFKIQGDILDLVDEVVQDTWVEIEVLAEKWRKGLWIRNWKYSFGGTFLPRVIYRRCLKVIFPLGRKKKPKLVNIDVADPKDIAILDPELKNFWRRKDIEALLATPGLSEKELKCIKMRYLEDKEVKEIAIVLKTTENMVRKHLNMGIKRIRKYSSLWEV